MLNSSRPKIDISLINGWKLWYLGKWYMERREICSDKKAMKLAKPDCRAKEVLRRWKTGNLKSEMIKGWSPSLAEIKPLSSNHLSDGMTNLSHALIITADDFDLILSTWWCFSSLKRPLQPRLVKLTIVMDCFSTSHLRAPIMQSKSSTKLMEAPWIPWSVELGTEA